MKKILKLIALSSLLVTMIPIVEGIRAEEDQSTYIPRPARPSELQRQRNQETSNENDETEAEEQTSSGAGDDTNNGDTDNDGETDTNNGAENNQDDPEEEETTVEALSPEDFLKDNFKVYTVYELSDPEDIEYLKSSIQEDNYTEDQYEVLEENIDDGLVRLRYEYSDQASENKRPLFIYIDAMLQNQEQAQNFINQQLNLFPDILSGGDILEIDNNERSRYDIALAIRVGAEAQKVLYNPQTKLIEYNAERQPYSYLVEEGQEDTIRKTIEEIFPDNFEFTEEETDEGTMVTMTPLVQQEISANVYYNGEEELTGWRRTINDIVSPIGLTYQNVIAGLAIILAIIGLVFIIFK